MSGVVASPRVSTYVSPNVSYHRPVDYKGTGWRRVHPKQGSSTPRGQDGGEVPLMKHATYGSAPAHVRKPSNAEVIPQEQLHLGYANRMNAVAFINKRKRERLLAQGVQEDEYAPLEYAPAEYAAPYLPEQDLLQIQAREEFVRDEYLRIQQEYERQEQEANLQTYESFTAEPVYDEPPLEQFHMERRPSTPQNKIPYNPPPRRASVPVFAAVPVLEAPYEEPYEVADLAPQGRAPYQPAPHFPIHEPQHQAFHEPPAIYEPHMYEPPAYDDPPMYEPPYEAPVRHEPAPVRHEPLRHPSPPVQPTPPRSPVHRNSVAAPVSHPVHEAPRPTSSPMQAAPPASFPPPSPVQQPPPAPFMPPATQAPPPDPPRKESSLLEYIPSAPPPGAPPAVFEPPPREEPEPRLQRVGTMHAVYTEAESNARKAFRKFDLKGRGFLDNNEATNAIRELGVCATFDEAQEMFESIDADGSGYVEEEEFVAFFKDNLVTIQNTIDPRQMATAMFLKFDADNSGELDVNEFIGAMRELGLGYTEEDAEQVFLSFDPDGSGGIDMDEFVEAYLEQWEMQKESQREAAAADFISGRDD
eukprot:CAMPEP_0174302912 /NCGR_PEP_ID=MMETSP0809-20121228/59876_1 /TAXON_ID=73025 ORGANISM="Eutreptiella gymnastica-like, Strain CCMP1594" /NCGR_SAMPLE_ID=MMETSP0809 /ASSEMBLY_ACC=CAM_ASM_000658 /LENGTH=584 /DNA_ID=CAMNT_0015408857 /DNA_START=138 /DNA_END=1892 /DNA_ORIENTATION=+